MKPSQVIGRFLGLFALAFGSHAVHAGGEKHLRFLHLADTHAQLDEHWEYLPEDPKRLQRMGGYARIKTALDESKKNALGSVFTVDGGDTFQGSAIAAWTKGEAVVAPLNALNIDVGTPGNWEVVYGPDQFRKLMSEVNYKVICYNFHETATGKRIFSPSAILERDGVKVAFIGVTDSTTTKRQPPAQVRGLDSTRLEGLREFVQKLKAKERPDLIVLVDHTGLAPSVQLAHDIPEFDIVLSGHTHERVYKPILVGKTIIVEPGSMGSFLGQLDVTLENGKISDFQYQLINVAANRYVEDPTVKAIIERNKKPFKVRLEKVVGSTKQPIMRYDVLETTMDNLVADAVKEQTHTDVSFTNGFRFSPPIAPGPITEADVWNMLPLDARLKVGSVSGKQLWNYLEDEMELVFAKDPSILSGGWGPRPSGLSLTFTAKANIGQRVKEVRINGTQINKEKFYQIGGCEREGELVNTICRLKSVQNAKIFPGTVHDAVEQYIKKHSPLDLSREGRVRATDLPANIWSQYGTLQKMWSIPGQANAVEPQALPGVTQ